MSASAASRRIVIEPVTRIEGHGKVTILMDEKDRVTQARFHIVEFRGFERFIQGRPYWEMPVAVQRLCGICPVSHHLCAAKATDQLVGVSELSPTSEKIRRLMHYGQFFQSHSLHFFHLASPDLLFGFESDPARRNVLGVAQAYPELATRAVMMRRYGQEVIKRTAGKKVHGTGAIPGGVNKNLTLAERDELLADIDDMIAWSVDAVKLARDYTLENIGELADFGSFPSNHMGLVRPDGGFEIYDGLLKAVDAGGEVLMEGVRSEDYLEHIAEEVRSWSYMKFPFLRKLGPEEGWYRVGPLARLNVCTHMGTPLADEALSEFRGAVGNICNVTLAYHWTRLIETLCAAEMIRDLLHDDDLQGEDLVRRGDPAREGFGILEAPRGTLFHHYRINEHDQVEMANLIVSTTNNNEPMNQAVLQVAKADLSGKKEITEGLLNRIEVAIRAYDPCLSCATHALGRMALDVQLLDSDGELIDRRIRE